MTPRAIVLCILAQLFLVAGQLFFKKAMDEKSPLTTQRKALTLTAGILAQTIWFFLWMGLLQHEDLSRVFPFEGLDPLLLVLAAWWVLGEKLTKPAWLGVTLITAGLLLVAF